MLKFYFDDDFINTCSRVKNNGRLHLCHILYDIIYLYITHMVQ